MIKYHCHTVTECTHIETKEKFYELSHWFTSSECPETAGRRSAGYFKSRKEAENHHNKMLVEGLLKEKAHE